MFLSSLYSLSWGWCIDRSSEFALSSFSFWIFKNNRLVCLGSVPELGSQAGVQGQAVRQPLAPGKAGAEGKRKAQVSGQALNLYPTPTPFPPNPPAEAAPLCWRTLVPFHPLSGPRVVKCKIRAQGRGGGLSPSLDPARHR